MLEKLNLSSTTIASARALGQLPRNIPYLGKELQEQLKPLQQIPNPNSAITSAIADLQAQIHQLKTQSGLETDQAESERASLKETFSDPVFWDTYLKTELSPEEVREVYRRYVDRVLVKDGEIVEVILTNLLLENSVNTMNTTIEQAQAILNHQTITETSPGTILQDFQTFLNLLKEEGIEVSGKHSLFPLKHLAALNAQLTEPTQLDLKRPVQKSYPVLNGIYLLLRTTGLAVVVSEKRKQKLVIDEATDQAWNQLNVTEQYFTLLEAWLVHASDETIGERDQSPALFQCMRFWQMLNQDEIQLTKELEGYFAFRYTPGWHNLALFDLFGLMRVEQGKPEKGKGWQVQRLEKTAYGKAILTVLRFALLGDESSFSVSSVFQEIVKVEPAIRFGKLQPLFQPYFPQWQNNLVVQQNDSKEGIYVFKTSLGKPWRRIAIPSFLCLDDLAEAILDAFEFSNDHLYQFIGKQSTGKTLIINHPFLEDPPCTDEFLVEALPLKIGQTMAFLFDLGSRWEFKLTLEEIQPLTQEYKQPQLLSASGQLPKQYDCDEESC